MQRFKKAKNTHKIEPKERCTGHFSGLFEAESGGFEGAAAPQESRVFLGFAAFSKAYSGGGSKALTTQRHRRDACAGLF
jgi:hypothetical protein